jgi:hypothetical protein
LSAEESETLWHSVQAHKADIEKRLPDEQLAIHAMTEAFHRLKDFGWHEAIYCPKDGSSFSVLEPGSSGIHRCHYYGEWPDGGWMIEEDGGCPSHPVLYRLDPEAEAARKAKMKEAIARYRAEHGHPAVPGSQP